MPKNLSTSRSPDPCRELLGKLALISKLGKFVTWPRSDRWILSTSRVKTLFAPHNLLCVGLRSSRPRYYSLSWAAVKEAGKLCDSFLWANILAKKQAPHTRGQLRRLFGLMYYPETGTPSKLIMPQIRSFSRSPHGAFRWPWGFRRTFLSI